MQLEQVDPVDLQVAQRELDLLLEVGRAADRRPDAGALPGEAGLGRDDQAVGVRVQRLGDDLLADERAVGVGGVDEVDALLDGGADDAQRAVAVGRLAPDAGAGQLHGAVAEAVDGQVPADAEGVAQLRSGHVSGQHTSRARGVPGACSMARWARSVRACRHGQTEWSRAGSTPA